MNIYGASVTSYGITLHSCEEGRNITVHELKVAVAIQRNTFTLRFIM
jgi:hypothetical protein